jgi:hypothetical protein
MIIVAARSRAAGERSRWSAPGAPGPQGLRRPRVAAPDGRERVVTGPVGGNVAAALGHGLIPGSARRLDMRS